MARQFRIRMPIYKPIWTRLGVTSDPGMRVEIGVTAFSGIEHRTGQRRVRSAIILTTIHLKRSDNPSRLLHESPTEYALLMEAIIARNNANATKAWARANAAGVHFVIAELELGLTFCALASSAGYERYARRNEAKARAAHEAALYYRASLVLAGDDLRDFTEKECRLKIRLRKLSSALPCAAAVVSQPKTKLD